MAAAVACGSKGGMAVKASENPAQSVPSAENTEIRQVDDLGRRLPFETRHAHRWNPANNGTVYEPCTALTVRELESLGVAASTVRDAAGTDGQTLRGCTWDYRAGSLADWRISQFVGNSASLSAEKERASTAVDIWLPDVLIGERAVGVHHFSDGSSCDTYVQSGRAAVTTLVTHVSLPHPPSDEICARAIAFTRATIAEMPR
ncbi:DUF3558 family protein [Gordonia sp. VNK21]|uniref:DUF3558 family protein n=1 Tax=Gordonia sp. VNK21 TaxID=3382483 RepID=UPI0038D41E67